MKTWPLQDAKNRFSEVVDLAQNHGPQTVTRHGKPVVVVISAAQFKNMARPRESIAAFLAPLRDSGVRLKRCRDLPRKIKT